MPNYFDVVRRIRSAARYGFRQEGCRPTAKLQVVGKGEGGGGGACTGRIDCEGESKHKKPGAGPGCNLIR